MRIFWIIPVIVLTLGCRPHPVSNEVLIGVTEIQESAGDSVDFEFLGLVEATASGDMRFPDPVKQLVREKAYHMGATHFAVVALKPGFSRALTVVAKAYRKKGIPPRS